jgi:hypothetical protein
MKRPLLYHLDAAAIHRDTRLRDLLAEIEEWKRASGADRDYYRRLALHDVAEFKRLYLVPERRAFEAAVRASKQRRAA